jgi:hypothetical protein
VVVALPRDLRDALQTLAARDGRDEGAVVRDALRRHLHEHGLDEEDGDRRRPLPRSLGMVSDPTLDSRQVKELIRGRQRPE